MDDQQPTTSKNSRFKLIVVVCLVVLAGAVGWLVYRTEDLSNRQEKTATTEPDGQVAETPNETGSGWNTHVKSGGSGFEVTVPDGWGPLVRPLDSDFIILPGTTQPTVAAGNKVEITDTESYGSDSPSVFSIMMFEKGEATAPRGEASEFTIGKGEEALTGKKYAYVYPDDESVGIGYTRFQGDRDYEYVFPFGDRELHVYYSVYGSDPRNLSATVDEIARTIKLAKLSPADL